MRLFFLLALAGASLVFSGCERDDDDSPTAIVITPEDNLMIEPGDTLQLEASESANWSATAGIIDDNGMYIAPNEQGKFIVTAASKTDPQNQAERTVLVTYHAELFKAMRNGNYVIYFRHANATVGIDNFNSTIPEWWKSCDSMIARQLSTEGRQQATQTGLAFKNIGLPINKIMSSEFCRCIQTAQRFDVEPVLPIETSQALTYTVYGDENGRYQRTLDLINGLPAGNGVVLLAAHSFPTGSPGPALQMGDAAIYKQQPNGAEQVAIVTVGDWIALR
jgi:phosphohistidine phosphatase SixA